MRQPRSGCGGVPMSGAARDSRSASKVGPAWAWVGWRMCAHVYLGVLGSDHTQAGLRVPGGGTPSKPAPPSSPWEAEGRALPRAQCPVPTPPPVVEELQVQILKLLLNNKDDNGVSVSQALVGPRLGGQGRLSSHGRGQAQAQH